MIQRLVLFAVALQLTLAAGFAADEVRRALVLGVSEYPNYNESRIQFAHIDALQFKSFLETDGAGRVEVKALTNTQATRDAIWDAVEELRHQQPKPDTLFVFFSGHAELDPYTEQLYLMPSGGDRRRLSSTGILAGEFITKLRSIGPTNLLVFLDACHTGAALLGKGGLSESVPGSLNSVIASLNRGNEGGVTAFVSAAKDELSWEDDEFSQGIFTRFLIKGLGGDADGVGDQKDGLVTAAELQGFLAREVTNRARVLNKAAQHPLVSPDFKGNYVISVANIAGGLVSTSSPIVVNPDLQLLQHSNPELALMVELGTQLIPPVALKNEAVGIRDNKSAPTTSPSDLHSHGWTSGSLRIVPSFELARAIKVGVLPPSVKPESLISPVISSDGSLLVACIDKSSIVSISLRPGSIPKRLDFVAQSSRPSSREILDSCEISISRDNNFAIARLRFIDESSRLVLVGLAGTEPPARIVDGYELGVVTKNGMLLSKAGSVTVVKPGKWDIGLTRDFGKPVRNLLSDPESANFGAVFDTGVAFIRLDDPESIASSRDYGSSIDTSAATCSIAGDRLFCFSETTALMNDIETRSHISGGIGIDCPLRGRARSFPSSTTRGVHGWSLLYGCSEDLETLYFARQFPSTSVKVRMPETVLTARLLSNTKVVAVGQRGGIYSFDSVKYGDCCTVQVLTAGSKVNVSAGKSGMTAVFEHHDKSGELLLFRDDVLIRRVTLEDSAWVEQINWSASNQIVALAGKASGNLMHFVGDDFRLVRQAPVPCGKPIVFGNLDSSIACVVPETQKIQLRAATTGSLRLELDGHGGPIHDLYLSATRLTAAGSFVGRSQTIVTTWNPADGKLVSQRYCQVGGSQAVKPLSLVRKGDAFAQLDAPHRLLAHQSLTCEPSKPVTIKPSSVLRGSHDSDWVVLLNRDRTAFSLLSPWHPDFAPSWDLDLVIEDISISANGHDVVVIVGGRIMRIPMTRAAFLDLVKRRVPREFSAAECRDFFDNRPCPLLKK